MEEEEKGTRFFFLSWLTEGFGQVSLFIYFRMELSNIWILAMEHQHLPIYSGCDLGAGAAQGGFGLDLRDQAWLPGLRERINNFVAKAFRDLIFSVSRHC